MNADLTVVERHVLTILDVLSDVGGLEAIIVFVFGSFVTIFNHNNLENYLTLNLF